MERKQFTFYESFWDALKRIRKKADRCDAYEAIVAYALNGTEPELDKLPDAAGMAFILAKPTLDASRRKAENGSKRKQTESKPEQTENKTDANRSKPETNGKREREREREREGERERDRDRERMLKETTQRKADEAFERFWAVYPKKVGKGDARKVWEKVMAASRNGAHCAPLQADALIEAVERQARSEQWTREGGRFVPNPATWLNQGRWEDELQPARGEGYQKHGQELSPQMAEWFKRSLENV